MFGITRTESKACQVYLEGSEDWRQAVISSTQFSIVNMAIYEKQQLSRLHVWRWRSLKNGGVEKKVRLLKTEGTRGAVLPDLDRQTGKARPRSNYNAGIAYWADSQ